MKRGYRIVLELLGPPFLGAVLLWLDEGISSASGGSFEKRGKTFVLFVVFAYVIAGIPSILYTAIMEWRFARGLDPRGWKSVLLSTTLGLISGLTMGFRGVASLDLRLGLFFGGIGAAVGFSLGLIVRIFTATKPASRSLP